MARPTAAPSATQAVTQAAAQAKAQAQAAAQAAAGSQASDTMAEADMRAFLGALARDNPEPKSDLSYADPFSLLVAVVLSAQATDASVNKATPALFAAAPTPAAMAALGADGIGPYIRTIGLWQGKARNLAELARRLVAEHGGIVPSDRAALEALPGVGRKTANVVLNVAFGADTMAVDTHIFRLGNRTGLAAGRTPREVEDRLVARVPPEMLRHAHHWLILHGRYVCKARAPECWRCVGAQWCRWPGKATEPAARTARKAKPARDDREAG